MPRDWSELVDLGRRAAARQGATCWELGDLALEAEPMAESRANTGSYERLREYAEAIGVEFESLKVYRTVARAWPEGTRVPSVPWVVHRVFLHREDRVELIRSRASWTYREAMSAVGRTTYSQSSRQEQAIELMRDPELVSHALADATAAEVVAEVVAEHAPSLSVEARMNLGVAQARIEQAALDERDRAEAGRARPKGGLAASGIVLAVSAARARLARALDDADDVDLDDEARDLLERELERLAGLTSWFRDYIRTGSRDFDDELAELLGGER